MKKLLMLALSAFLATGLGCKSEDGAKKPAEKKADKVEAPKAEAPKAEAPKAEEPKAADPAAAASTGIPECDAYQAEMEKLAKCDKLPVEARKPMADGFEAAKGSWAALKDAPPEAKAGAATGCKAGADAVTAALKAAGC